MGALGRMLLHLSPTCLPHLSPTLVSHSGCSGLRDFALVSRLSPRLGPAHFFFCPGCSGPYACQLPCRAAALYSFILFGANAGIIVVFCGSFCVGFYRSKLPSCLFHHSFGDVFSVKACKPLFFIFVKVPEKIKRPSTKCQRRSSGVASSARKDQAA